MPFEVGNYEDLKKVGSGEDGWDLDEDYELTDDIQCDPDDPMPLIVDLANMIPFSGSFDGQGYKIKDLVIEPAVIDAEGNTGASFAGFGGIGEGKPELKNIEFEGIQLDGDFAGLMLLLGNGGEIENVTVSGSLTGTRHVAGLVAGTESITDTFTFKYCYNHATIESEEHAGGMIGWTPDAGTMIEFEDCSNSGDITLTDTGDHTFMAAGGIAGWLGEIGGIKRCFSTGKVEVVDAKPETSIRVGGFIGRIRCSEEEAGGIKDCYATGDVEADDEDTQVAGFCPRIEGHTKIKDCYSAGKPTKGEQSGHGFGSETGEDSQVTDCFWDTETSETTNDDSNATGKTTSQMQDVETFDEWDIETVDEWDGETWFIQDGENYPRLAAIEDLPKIVAEVVIQMVRDVSDKATVTSQATRKVAATTTTSASVSRKASAKATALGGLARVVREAVSARNQTSRQLSGVNEAQAQSVSKINRLGSAQAQASQSIAARISVSASVIRRVRALLGAPVQAVSKIDGISIVSIQTGRGTNALRSARGQLSREVRKRQIALSQTKREITEKIIAVARGMTARKINRVVEDRGQISRSIGIKLSVMAQMSKVIRRLSISNNQATRTVSDVVVTQVQTPRQLSKLQSASAQTKREVTEKIIAVVRGATSRVVSRTSSVSASTKRALTRLQSYTFQATRSISRAITASRQLNRFIRGVAQGVTQTSRSISRKSIIRAQTIQDAAKLVITKIQTIRDIEEAEVDYIVIEGPEEITVPHYDSIQKQYEAIVYNQFDERMEDKEVFWNMQDLEGGDVEEGNVIIDDGLVTVYSEASGGNEFIIIATIEGVATLGSLRVELYEVIVHYHLVAQARAVRGLTATAKAIEQLNARARAVRDLTATAKAIEQLNARARAEKVITAIARIIRRRWE